jgi:hypothetical protein
MERIEARLSVELSLSLEAKGRIGDSSIPSLLPVPTGSTADFASEIATLVIQHAHAQRKEARESARQDEQQTRAAEDQTIATMRAKARAARSYAHAAGWMTIAGGAASCFGSIAGAGVTKESSRSAQYLAAGLKSSGDFGLKLGDFPKGLGDASAMGRDASIEQSRAVSRRALHDEDQAQKDAQEARDLADRVLAMVKDIDRVHADTMMAAIRRA